jgi:hypothetical protein
MHHPRVVLNHPWGEVGSEEVGSEEVGSWQWGSWQLRAKSYRAASWMHFQDELHRFGAPGRFAPPAGVS